MTYTNCNCFFDRAKKNKNDEYYTTEETVERMLSFIDLSVLEDKVVWCPFNCANGQESEFVKYFKRLEKDGKIKELIVSGYNFFDKIEEMKRADYVIDNPPFSIQNKIIALLEKYKKNFYLIIGNNPATMNFAFERGYSLWCGDLFFTKDGEKVNLRNNHLICSFADLSHAKKKLNPEYITDDPKLWADFENIDVYSPYLAIASTTSFMYDVDNYYYPYSQINVGNSFRRILWINKEEREREQFLIDYILKNYENVKLDKKFKLNSKIKTKSIFDF